MNVKGHLWGGGVLYNFQRLTLGLTTPRKPTHEQRQVMKAYSHQHRVHGKETIEFPSNQSSLLGMTAYLSPTPIIHNDLTLNCS